ncbi:transposase [Brevibacterium aurantiacum]|uniref:Transposase n=1 Tax=Brevibacterium aurantiacum TaxID=273384 RepID=A0A4Z0KG54_BREAU|nr:transposase [Brevibacterium aurantiacum]
MARIRYHFEFWDHTYGYRRITAELADDPHVDEPVNRKPNTIKLVER